MHNRVSLWVRTAPVLVFSVLVVMVQAPVAHADAGSLTLTVNSWHQDQSTGLADYDVTLSGAGLGGTGGMCNTINGCGWEVTAWYKDGTSAIGQGYLDAGSGLLDYSTDTFTRTLTATSLRMNEVTDIKATLSGNGITLTQWAHVADVFPQASPESDSQ